MISSLKRFFRSKKKESESPLINILTRTSQRPQAFDKCRESVKNQSYENIRHLVSYDKEEDLEYLNRYDVEKIRVHKTSLKNIPVKKRREHLEFAPYNLYCNKLLKEVKEGWIIFLDDDDAFTDEHVIEYLVSEIKRNNSRTLLIWQMKYPDGKVLPEDELISKKKIELYRIGAPCIMFHSRYARKAKWDAWKCADFRFIKKMSEIIPEKVWIKKPLVGLGNFGGFGRQEDFAHRD